jgi:hypothetical protein
MVQPHQIDQILTADQNYIVLQARKYSKGDFINGITECQSCRTKLELEYNIDKFPVHVLEDPTEEDMKRGFRVFKISDEKLECEAEFRYPQIMDYNRSSVAAKNNQIESQNMMMLSCLRRLKIGTNEYAIDPSGKTPFDLKFFNNLSWKYVEFLVNSFQDKQPGPEMELYFDCYACGFMNMVPLSDTDFLLSLPKKRKRTL